MRQCSDNWGHTASLSDLLSDLVRFDSVLVDILAMGYHCLTPSVRLTTMDVSEISSTCKSDLTHLQLFSISDCNRHAGELHRSVVMDADYLRSTSLPPDEGNCQASMACIAHMLKSDCGL